MPPISWDLRKTSRLLAQKFPARRVAPDSLWAKTHEFSQAIRFLCNSCTDKRKLMLSSIKSRSHRLNSHRTQSIFLKTYAKLLKLLFIIYELGDRAFKTISIAVRSALPAPHYRSFSPAPNRSSFGKRLFPYNPAAEPHRLAFLMIPISLTVVTPLYKP